MQGASLEFKKQGVKLIGEEGAEIHATNWDDQSIQLKAANTGIYNVKLTAEVRDRQSMLRHQRIGVMADHVSVIDNHIIGGSAAGIFAYGATHYLIEGNEVEKTLADGIHSTGKTQWGKIIGNVVHDTGDDMIAVVSYCCDAPPVRDIMIENNHVSSAPFARGIAVLGGEDITIRNNNVEDVVRCAGILINRELYWNTRGVRNVMVENNNVSNIQTIGNHRSRTGQGGIDINAQSGDRFDVHAGSAFDQRVEGVLVRNNKIRRTLKDGILLRGQVCDVGLLNNDLSEVGREPIEIDKEVNQGCVSCMGTSVDGRPWTLERCASEGVPVIAGAQTEW